MGLRIGIIGCGTVAADHVKAFISQEAEIVALLDADAAAAQKLAAASGGAQVFSSLAKMLEHGGIDAVSICTPPSTHEAFVLEALGRGIHVLCEKPLAHTLESGRRMVAAATAGDAILMPAYRHRYLPAIRAIRQRVQSGQIGRPISFANVFCGPAFEMEHRWFACRNLSGGGAMIDTSSHSVDLFRYIFGEVTMQQAAMSHSFANTDVEDSSVLLVQSESGVIGSLTASWVSGTGVATIDIMGQEGRLFYDYEQPERLRLKRAGQSDWELIPVSPSNGFSEEVADFIAAINSRREPECTVQDGLRALEIIAFAYGQHYEKENRIH